MNIGIVGSRTFTDQKLMVAVLLDLKFYDDARGKMMTWWNMTLVSGGAVGADQMAERLYREDRDRPKPIIHLPRFDLYPEPACYFQRNSLIVDDSDILLAFFGPGEPPSVNKSGTMDTVRKAMAKRIPVHLYFQS